LPQFLQQYTDRFPGLDYLHLSLEQGVGGKAAQEDLICYYGDGKCLRIRLVKEIIGRIPTPYEIYEELRFIFDTAVAQSLENRRHDFFAENYL
jgi:hypothetical protein